MTKEEVLKKLSDLKTLADNQKSLHRNLARKEEWYYHNGRYLAFMEAYELVEKM